MKGTRVASVFLAVFVLASLSMSAHSAGEDVDIEVGDFWSYSLDFDEDEMIMTGTVKMEVDRTATVGGKAVFYVEMSGSGDVSVETDDMTVTGSFDLSGDQVRLRSDFDLVSEGLAVDMEVGALGFTMEMTMGFEMDYSPSMDDYIGDGDMELDSIQTSEFTATEMYWMSGFGENESDSSSTSGESTLTVVDDSVSVTVPAGTFDCCKVKVETTIGDSAETAYWYYSDEVGNYVKADLGSVGFGGIELEEYSHGDDGGALSMFTGDNLWLTLLIIIVVVVIIAVAIAMKVRRGKAPTPMTPPQPDTQMPPPPGPAQPPAPPPMEPAQPPQSPPPG